MKTLRLFILEVFFLIPGILAAQTYPPGFSKVLLATSLANPTSMAFAPDGRIFIAEQGGRMLVIKDGIKLPTPFMKLTVDSADERGLVGVAIDPDFENNSYLYAYY